jgi:hypothetical protein
MNGVEIIVPIIMFVTVFGIVYVAVSARNKERMALIEKGADASIFNRGNTGRSGKWALKLGMLSIGVALGVLVGYLFESMGMNDDVAYPAGIFLFGGGALVAAFYISRKTAGEQE